MLVRADLHNHFTTKSKVLDPNRVAHTVREKLGVGGICALVNYQDQRYEAFAERAEQACTSSVNLGNAISFWDGDVLIIKGQEIPTEAGDLLVLGLDENVHLPKGKSLEYSISDAHERGGIVIITTPFYRSAVGRKLYDNPKIMLKVHAIETHDGEAPCSANSRAADFYRTWKNVYPHLGRLSNSDGHAFNEIGSSYTSLEMSRDDYSCGSKLVDDLKSSLLLTSSVDDCHHRAHSLLGSLVHKGILAPMVLLGKAGIQLSKGDREALLSN